MTIVRNRTIFRRGIAAVAALALAGTLASCAQSQRETDSSSEQSTSQDFVFAASSDPVMLDPAMASDGETFRIARQQFEGLISTKPGTTELEPLLATEWKASSDGKSFTFTLREGVKFSDGTDFNAEAVCANFERWYNWTGVNQSENISYYYGKLFRGFKTGKTGGIYDGCTAVSPTEVTIKLNRPFAAFVDAMTLPAFSMQSPTALKQYNADDTSGTADDPRFSAYATEHPTGTGPFVFEKWERNQQVTLKRNDNYWGDKAKADRVIIRTISDPKARTQELQAGNIDGYDLVGPADVQPLKDAGFQIQNRPAFNILYLGMNQKNKALAKIKVREAIAHAIDKQAVVKSSLPDGSITATQFMPDLVEGYNDQIKDPDYNVDEAKKLLAEAGESDLVLKFAYPTGVSRPYMPSPEDTFAVIKSQLEKAGIKITPVAAKWSPDYLDMIQGDAGTSKHDIHLLGWTGDYNDPDNFVGVFFGGKSSEWGFDNPELFKALADARELPTREQQVPAYKQINADIAEFVPGIPLAHPAPSLAFAKGVQGYVASPVQDEVWNNVTVTR
ncbi:putative peptide ABC transporter substrate-binding protein [Microlunatus phosphovorus NM-1]|uniref:Putative peptide ABC transporter substrate-binding protein n=1 Tax=Microlunatus phosphovorus (strain ATCC 700054 / DSM 10555 / JCM 9379 / NBRC 101784 / NCIMB 13414 / VKM Ac-1990 / NM-1) TaxID=1032480 RepID=F5XNY4_MICPN|nr:putative peptide ABC transporter substrate-binding protein [Microlunatus phosphovorus NM-1]